MKILLLQLPFQGHDFFFSHENIPLASAYLRGIAQQNGCGTSARSPDELWQRSGDSSILIGCSATTDRDELLSMEYRARESLPLPLPNGQKVPCHPVCLVASPGKTIPPWFPDHILQRYSSPPTIKLWQSPDDESD
jgi:hypothetical protein